MGKFYFSQIYEKTGQDPGKYSDFLKAFRILEKKLKESFFFVVCLNFSIQILLCVGFLFCSKSGDFILQGCTPETITNPNICLKHLYYFLLISTKSVRFLKITLYSYSIMCLQCWFHLYDSTQAQSLWWNIFLKTFIHKHSYSILSFAK